MSEVIETDFVLGKIDGQRYEPVAIELRNRLRRNGRLKDCLDTILETFDDTTSAMLFSAVASLIDKMFTSQSKCSGLPLVGLLYLFYWQIREFSVFDSLFTQYSR